MELNRDGDGFLVNTNDWSEEVMNQMALEDDFEITEEIKNSFLDKALDDIKFNLIKISDG